MGNISSPLLSMQPYLITLILMTLATLSVKAKYMGIPRELGIPYAREENKYEQYKKLKMFNLWDGVST